MKKPLGNVLGHAAATALAVAIGYTVLTVLHITFGELVPKIYTVGHAEGVARRLLAAARVLHRACSARSASSSAPWPS